MRIRGGIFWGIALIALAVLLLLKQMDILRCDVFGYFWALLIMFAGVWLILSYFSRGKPVEGEPASVPLEGAQSAKIDIDHGAGRLNIRSGAPSDLLVSGTFANGVAVSSRLSGDRLEVRLKHEPRFWNWAPGDSLDWDVLLNRDIPIILDIDSGASASVLDLSDLKVTELDLDTGASSTDLTLPAAAGMTHVKIDTGVSAVKVRIPAGVAARIRAEGGIAAINVDRNRFPSQGNKMYESADYATAANKVDLRIEAGVGAVDII